MNFASDNAVGASASILSAIVAANAEAMAGYGEDALSLAAEEALRRWFERDVSVFFVATGTAANALAIGAFVPPWGAALCHRGAHLANDECGAPEFFSGGAKLLLVDGDAGKITPHTLASALDGLPRAPAIGAAARVVRQSRPTCLSLSQATEAGTLYTQSEISALSALARDRDLAVHMDGARFANALVALEASPADLTWRAGVDVLSLGATKNGALACEAVIFFDPARAASFAYQRKRAGHTLSKGRFLGAQMLAWLKDDHWRDLAQHANAKSAQLAKGLAAIDGIRLAWPQEINEVFAFLPKQVCAALRRQGAQFYDWHDATHSPLPEDDAILVRLVTSFATNADDIEAFLAIARSAAASALRSVQK